MNYLKKFAYTALLIALIVCFSVSTQAKEWKGWNIHVAGYPNTIALDKFVELVSQKSGGKMKIKMYHAGTLGSQPFVFGAGSGLGPGQGAYPSGRVLFHPNSSID